ncbi:Ribosomal RNA small subunit methyltransferase E [Sporotomaculum syntrophicum]|uniref:Ribosomal RNA small subunit methyltransferase E n=1 Tax=Sporotomaculum syntrophicum TaxID=182264 RepID=A0A9D3AXU1_9FIRM|nr:16S rRNA (uracil(1498)-N(3))-methyltransferase [Sporotomaculum syntrophicum]KAF1084089.1 Ribosomal RNA small subunit methyltransferase E [Sporotomaculum syntrophicum]
MPRFFVAPERVQGGSITITGPDVHHIKRVLRLGTGDIISLLDGCGNYFECRIENLAAEFVYCQVLRQGLAGGEPPLRVVLIQGLAKGDRMDTVIQKGTELGAAAFWPVVCKRSVVKVDVSKKASRIERWRRIATGATKQCRRALVPEVAEPLEWSTAMDMIPPGALVLVLWEDETGHTLKEELQHRPRPDEVYLLIGPEGGLEQQEVAEACRRGGIPVTLGPRILRTETAGPAALAMLLYQWGDLGG